MPRRALWVPQVVLTGARQGASSNTHECPRVPRSMGAALGTPVPCWAPRAMPGGRREVEPGWGEIPALGKERQKREKPPQKGAEAAAGRTAPITQTKNPAAVPPRRRLPRRLFGGPRSPWGPGLHPPRSYILLVRRILAFALPQPIHTSSAPGPRAGAGPPTLCPPRAPWPRMTPPEPALASLVLHDI